MSTPKSYKERCDEVLLPRANGKSAIEFDCTGMSDDEIEQALKSFSKAPDSDKSSPEQ